MLRIAKSPAIEASWACEARVCVLPGAFLAQWLNEAVSGSRTTKMIKNTKNKQQKTQRKMRVGQKIGTSGADMWATCPPILTFPHPAALFLPSRVHTSSVFPCPTPAKKSKEYVVGMRPSALTAGRRRTARGRSRRSSSPCRCPGRGRRRRPWRAWGAQRASRWPGRRPR